MPNRCVILDSSATRKLEIHIDVRRYQKSLECRNASVQRICVKRDRHASGGVIVSYFVDEAMGMRRKTQCR